MDNSGNSYVTGYSPGANGYNDIVTIAYGSNGNQLWVQRHRGPGNGRSHPIESNEQKVETVE